MKQAQKISKISNYIFIISLLLLTIQVKCLSFSKFLQNNPEIYKTLPSQLDRKGTIITKLCQKTQIASGFEWAENLITLKNNTIIVSDDKTGFIWALDPLTEVYEKRIINQGNFDAVLGLAGDQNNGILYAVTKTGSKNAIVQIQISNVNKWEIFINLQDNMFFNGLAFNPKTQKLYTTNENNFIPNKGILVEIDITSKTINSLSHPGKFLQKGQTFTGADGAYINEKDQILYISEVMTLTGTKIVGIDLNTGEVVSSVRPPAMSMIDDFVYIEENDSIVGADFYSGTVVLLKHISQMNSKANNYYGTIIAQGLNTPTSVRVSKNEPNTYFVTEGGALDVKNTPVQRLFKIQC